jgi:hypothetical protein
MSKINKLKRRQAQDLIHHLLDEVAERLVGFGCKREDIGVMLFVVENNDSGSDGAKTYGGRIGVQDDMAAEILEGAMVQIAAKLPRRGHG